MDKPRLTKRIRLWYLIKRRLRPFLASGKDNLRHFQEIETNIPGKLLNLINSLQQYAETYATELSEFKEFEKKAQEHNNEIAKLKAYRFKIDAEDFYKNPKKYNGSEFHDDFEIAKTIAKYSYVDLALSLKAHDIIEIVENYSIIVKEYELYQKYERVLLFEDRFCDSRKAARAFETLQSIKLELTNAKYFYDFTLLEESEFKKYVEAYNADYVQRHISDKLFDDIDGKSLDDEQRRSILKDGLSSLTIAGAGSGKTTTICGKIKYLLNQGVNPSDILLLSYSKKSADDLGKKAKRINENLTVGTFHKTGLEILEAFSGRKFMVEDQFAAIIENYFKEEAFKNTADMKDVLRYYALFSRPNSQEEKFNDEGSLFKSLKNKDFKTLKDVLSNISGDKDKKITIKKERVKSIEELDIANFYFLNGINYDYEKPYEHNVGDEKHRQYTPDFYLKDYGIYHEHYGIDKNGKASQFKGEEAVKYEQGVTWKRNIHNQYKTKCIETFSYEFSNATIFDKLTNCLKENGVKFRPLKMEEIKNALNSVYGEKSFKSMINLIKSFLSLYKANYQDASGFDLLKKSTFPNEYQKIRASIFIDICKKIYVYYTEYLAKENKIDFDDMILKSKEAIKALPNFKYRYVIVDEFQDISYSRMEFLKSLIEHGESKLFAVGDDWQAIYRFSGCDLGLFLNFENCFGESEINYITSTHRNSQDLQDIAGPFIKKNPQQLRKTIKSDKRLRLPIKLVYFEKDKFTAFQQTLALISKREPDASVLVLGRNNKDIEDIQNDDIRIINSFGTQRNSALISKSYPGLKIHYSTVHGSKGLEDDYVIIINADDGILGFPNQMEDDPLLNLVLSEKDSMEYAEERRLWYVALTRTRGYCYILVNSRQPSCFVDEIKEQCETINGDLLIDDSTPLLCPHCKSGRLILKKDKLGNEFYACSNFPYCDYTIDDILSVKRNIRCSYCGDFLIKKHGKFGTFYGCHGYPYCDYKSKY